MAPHLLKGKVVVHKLIVLHMLLNQIIPEDFEDWPYFQIRASQNSTSISVLALIIDMYEEGLGRRGGGMNL